MALTRKFLTALGIDGEKIDEIINAHAETVDALKEERDRYKADAEKLPGVQSELDELKAKSTDDYKAKYEDEKKAFSDYKAAVTAEKTLAAKKDAYTTICKDAGLSEKGVEKAMKYANWNAIELESDGKVKDASAKIQELKTEWAEYVVQQETRGADTKTPPAGNGVKGQEESPAARLYQQHYAALYGAPEAQKGQGDK